MSFEEDIAKFNEFYFFREFTFSENTFRKSPTEEVELADNVVWLDDTLIVYQLKERQAPIDTTSEKEQKWFKKNIIGDKYVTLLIIYRITVILKSRIIEGIPSTLRFPR